MKSDKLTNTLGLYLLAALLGAGLIGYFAIRPVLASGQKTAAKVTTVNQQIASLHQLDADTQKLRSNYEAVKGQRDAILQLLPVQTEEERLLALLNDLAVSSGVVLSSFSPGGNSTPSKLTSVSVYPASVNVTGSFAQIQQFLAKVENSARFIDVQSANESASQVGRAVALGVSLDLNAYYQGQTSTGGAVAKAGGTQ